MPELSERNLIRNIVILMSVFLLFFISGLSILFIEKSLSNNDTIWQVSLFLLVFSIAYLIVACSLLADLCNNYINNHFKQNNTHCYIEYA